MTGKLYVSVLDRAEQRNMLKAVHKINESGRLRSILIVRLVHCAGKCLDGSRGKRCTVKEYNTPRQLKL